jgi:Rod binding domain-containing protein
LHKAASEFESLLVKQMLKQSKIAGDDKANGYADMAIDAMASAVEKGGGFGLVRSIEAAIGPRAGLSDTTKGTSKR